MSNYTKTTNFATKDALVSGNPAKIVKGTEIDTEFNNIAVASGTKADKASPTFTGTVNLPITTAASLSVGGDGVTVTGIKDEDDMASNSATKLASQQSIKAYVDSQVTAQDLDVTDGTTSISIDLDSEALSLLGGTGVTSTALGNGVTLAIDATVATLTGSQTLSNKTLTTPAITGPLTTDSTIDGRDVAVDGTKLDTVETNADVTDTTNVTAAGALMDSEVTNLAQVKAFDSADYATAAQGATADAALPKAGGAMTGAITTNSTIDGRDVAVDGAKLDGIEVGATADQTAAEIRTLVEAATDSNVFTDADHTKLNGIEALADVTDVTNVTAAGALMDSELTSITAVKALNQGVATTDSPTFTGIDVTGTATMDGLTVEQNVGSKITLKSTDSAIAAGEVLGDIEFFSSDLSGVGPNARANITVEAEDAAGRGKMYFKTSTGGEAPLNRMLIQGNGDVSFYEDTGTTPKLVWSAVNEKLTLSGTGGLDVTGITKLSGTQDEQLILNSTDNGPVYMSFKRSDDRHAYFGFGSSNDIFSILNEEVSGQLSFGTAGTEAMRIDSAGRVLINKTSSTSSLNLEAQAPAGFSIGSGFYSASTQSTIEFKDSGTTANYKVRIGSAADDMIMFAGGSERMRIDSVGNVGVGTSSPASTLEIAKNDQTNGATLSITNSHDGAGWTAGDTVGSIDFRIDDGSAPEKVSGQIKVFDDTSVSTTYPAYSAMSFSTSLLGTFAERMRISSAGVVEFKGGITEAAVTLTGTATTINLATATNFVHDLTGATTYTFSNPAVTGNVSAFTLKIIQDSTARTITWPSSVDWPGGTAPTLTATSGGVDIFTFFTLDGGVTYYGFTAGQAMA